MTTHLGLFNQGPTLYPGVDPFEAGVSLVIQATLQSPYLMYRAELGTAAAGELRDSAGVTEHANRLLDGDTGTVGTGPNNRLVAKTARAVTPPSLV